MQGRIQDWNKEEASASFMIQFPTHLYFKNSAEEFYRDGTLSIFMKLLSSISSLIQCYISIFNVHETLKKLY
jgi:hypothetical protein